MSSTDSTSFVRQDMLPEKPPPALNTGVLGWIRENLFPNWLSGILTILSLLIIYALLAELIPWAFRGIWNAGSLNECREIARDIYGEGVSVACWAVIHDRFWQLMYGFYPDHLYWRPNMAFVLLIVALVPVLFDKIPRGIFLGAAAALLVGYTLLLGTPKWYVFVQAALLALPALLANSRRTLLIVTAATPFLGPWLLWGGSLWVPIMAAAGFGIGYLVYRLLAESNELLAMILGPLVAIAWWLLLAGRVAGVFEGIIPLSIEAVQSRQFGGFMLSITLGITGIAASFPLGIVLALGRQSDLLIVKSLSVGFIEFIRGVPLITLLFVAQVMLAYFLPKGTDFDIILRVMIMITLFAAAYMAEVIRGGLAALPKGQYEAADALGLTYWQAQRLIIMPQALKIAIPGIVSTFIGLFKDTTLVSIIGLADPIGWVKYIQADANWNGVVWELYGFVAFVFFIFCFAMGRYSMYLERKLETGHK